MSLGSLFSDDHYELGSLDPFGILRFKLPTLVRSTHTYVIGVTGKGKSKLLEHLLFQDIVAGRGCGLLDPHSDLADDLLKYLASYPKHSGNQWSRIVYFDPSRDDFLIPFNVLSTSFPPYATATNIVEAFRRTWPESLREAPRFANILLASLLTLICNRLTLADLPRLLMGKEFREECLQNVKDPEVVSVFHDRMDKWGREEPLILESVLNKVTAFTLNPTLRLILGHHENRLDFRRIMDEGKVLIADLGRCDAETRRLLGSLIVTGMEQAALSRKDELKRSRKPFYFYVDEFQDFVANEGSALTFAQILSEARKFGLHLTLAHQTLSQLSQRIRGALGNIQTKVVFGVEREDAEIMARRLFLVHGEEVKHNVEDEDQQERTHPIFYSLSEQWEKAVQHVQSLPARHALIVAPGRGVSSIRTIKIKERECSIERLLQIKCALAKQSGIATAEIGTVIDRKKASPAFAGRSDGEIYIREKSQDLGFIL